MGEMNSNGTSKISLGTTKVDMPCYIGPQVEESVILPDGPSKCMLYAVPVSFSFATDTNYLKEQATATDFVYSPMFDGKNILLRTGSSNVKAFPASELIVDGRISLIYHEEDLEFERWRYAVEGDKAISYFELEKEVGLIEGQEKLAYSDPRDTPSELLNKFVRPIIDCEIPNNLLGRYLSYNENFRGAIRRTLLKDYVTRYDKDTVDLIDSLIEEYGTPRNIIEFGSQKMAAVARLVYDNKHSRLIGSIDFHKKAKAMAEAYGLKGRKATEFFEKYVIFHEIVHNFQEHMSEREAEIDTSETLMKYFIRKAGELEGTEEGKFYRILAKEAEAYAECYRKNGSLNSKFKSKNLESKIAKLEVEARNLNLEGKEARDYITKRLGEDEEVDKEHSKESDLEGKVDEADRTYEGIEAKEYNEREITGEYTEADKDAGKGETTDDDVGESAD